MTWHDLHRAADLLPEAPLAPAHTDWLYHHLRVSGPARQVAAFRHAAAGAGVIPWPLDLDQLEEDCFLRLVAPPVGQRTLSLDGARLLAAALRDAAGRRHALAVARVRHSAACPFDLHALLPVPADILRLGPGHPGALQWLWANWGTTQALRHVTLLPGQPDQEAGFAISFWAADWTPWRALAAIEAAWSELRLTVRPIYELT